MSLATMFPDDGLDLGPAAVRPGRGATRPTRRRTRTSPAFKPVAPGSYTSAAIILLTDGHRTTGPDSLESAQVAADRGVRVFTVGVGTPQGEIIGFDGWSMRVRLDEETLKQIADITHGEYFYAGNAVDLKKIYENLNARLVMEKKETEISALFARARRTARGDRGGPLGALVPPDPLAGLAA